MKTAQEILKIKAALLYILKSFPDGVDFIKLFKILYFAQRNHLAKYGRGIVNDTFYALKYGPVPSFSYKAMQVVDGRIEDESFSEFTTGFDVNKGIVRGTDNPDLDELSVSDISYLDKSIRDHKDIDPYDLSELSHDEAWMKAKERIQDDPEKDIISIIDIARSGKANDGMIEYIRDKHFVQRFVACGR